MQEIDINGKKYNIECNGLTLIHYKKVFNRGILADCSKLQEFLIRQVLEVDKLKKKYPKKSDEVINSIAAEVMLNYVDEFIENITRIAYIMIYTANPNVESYEEFLAGINKIEIASDWVKEVTELAVKCFCGG